jgi:biopolymer transport protein ExbD
MSAWKMRHEGSPEFVDGLTPQQIVTGVVEGQWEPTDEVMGPNDAEWKPLEQHPHFAEAMADYEPPPPPPHPDETRLDMNPLIDVALVLLIFFILTTTYQELRKKYPAPEANKNNQQAIATEATIQPYTIRVTVRQESGKPVIKVHDEIVAERDLEEKFKYWRTKTGIDKLAVDMDKNAPWKVFMAIQDAAAGAGIQETIRLEYEAPAEE